jgi:hypothetical protein
MRQRRIFLCLLLPLIALAACSPGHLGSSEIAFIRDGHLWTVDPNSTNAFQAVAQDTSVIGYSWSPTHQILVFRTFDEQFAKTTAARQVRTNAITGQLADAPSVVNTVGVDGGNAIPIMLSDPRVQYSNPMWNMAGTRLLYRQEATGSSIPGNAMWLASQNDQPNGIAAKILPSSESLLSLSYTDSSAIGITERGIFTAPLNGASGHLLVSGPLTGHPLPSALERVLWQPQHTQPYLLYAKAALTKQATGQFSETALTIQLVLRTFHGQERTLATCDCTQFAWSPDGNTVLYSTGQTDTLVTVTTGSTFSFPVEGDSVPYWSPNSKFLLLDGSHTLQIVDVTEHQQRTLLSDGAPPEKSTIVAGVNALLQPVPNSLWAADSEHFIFLTRGRLNWQGQMLRTGKGLYTVTANAQGQPQGIPTVVDTGNDTQVGWSYQDANTSFLY